MKTETASASKVPQEIINALGLGTIGLLGLLYVAVLILVRAWCITKLWAWFVVPLGLPALGLLAAIGLTMTISVVMGLDRLEQKKTVIQCIVGHLACVGFGWCIHFFM